MYNYTWKQYVAVLLLGFFFLFSTYFQKVWNSG